MQQDIDSLAETTQLSKEQIASLEARRDSLDRLLTSESLIDKKDLFDNPTLPISDDDIPVEYREIVRAKAAQLQSRLGNSANEEITKLTRDLVNPFRVNKLGLILSNTEEILTVLNRISETILGERKSELDREIITLKETLGISGEGVEIKSIDVTPEQARKVFAIGHIGIAILGHYFESTEIAPEEINKYLQTIFPFVLENETVG